MPTIWTFIKNRFRTDKAYGLGLTLAFLFVGVAFWAFVEVVESWTQRTDFYHLDAWFQQVVADVSSTTLTTVMRGVTEFGSTWVAVFLVGIVIVVLYRQRKAYYILALVVAFTAGEGLIYALKMLFHRARPEGILISTHSASFPSGHAFTALVVFGFFIYYLNKQPVSSYWRIIGTIALALLIGLVGFSRIYLHAHYFTDVAGGFILGLMWLVVSLTLTRLFYRAAPSQSVFQDE